MYAKPSIDDLIEGVARTLQFEVFPRLADNPDAQTAFPAMLALLDRIGSEWSGMAGHFVADNEAIEQTLAAVARAVENEPAGADVQRVLASLPAGNGMAAGALAERNHYPAIDPLMSVSRVMPAVVGPAHLRDAGAIRASLAEYEGAKDLIEVGAYAPGSNPAIDEAIVRRPAIVRFLAQTIEETIDVEGAAERLAAIMQAVIPPIGPAAAAGAGVAAASALAGAGTPNTLAGSGAVR